MTLKRVSVVIDTNLWSDDFSEQMNAIEQGLINALGHPDKYPVLFEKVVE